MTQPEPSDLTDRPAADPDPEPRWWQRLPGARTLLSVADAGLGEVLIVVLLLISMPLALLLVVAGFHYGGWPGGGLLLAAVIAGFGYLWWRSRH